MSVSTVNAACTARCCFCYTVLPPATLHRVHAAAPVTASAHGCGRLVAPDGRLHRVLGSSAALNGTGAQQNSNEASTG